MAPPAAAGGADPGRACRSPRPWPHELAGRDWLLFACGRYEGIDARVVEHAASRMDVLEVSLGDYVLNGGEVAALAITEAVVRLLPGVLGNPESLVEESHGAELDGLLEYPVYTKPAIVARPGGAGGAAVRAPRAGGFVAAGAGTASAPRSAVRISSKA